MHSPAVVLLKDVGMNIHLCAYVCVCVCGSEKKDLYNRCLVFTHKDETSTQRILYTFNMLAVSKGG